MAAAQPPPAGPDGEARIAALFRAGMAALDAAARAGLPQQARAERLDGAVAAFRAILIHRPGALRVRLELARAFFLKEEDGLARRHFERVLAAEPPAAVVANVQRLLHIMRARRRWSAGFGAAVIPDSNPDSASGAETIWLDTPFGRLPFTRGRETAPQSGLGLSVWGGGEYQHPLRERLRLRAGANGAMRQYKGRGHDRLFAAAHLGPRWLAGPATEFSLLAAAQRQWAAGRPENDYLGLRLEGAHRLTRRTRLEGAAGLRRRDCRGCNRLDGPVGRIALDAAWAALPVLRLHAGAGYDWSRARAKSWRSRGRSARIGASVDLPLGFTLGARARLRWTGYEGGGAAHLTRDGRPRADRTRTLSLSAHNRALTVLGFSPRLTVTNEVHETNAQALDYKRTFAEIGFVRQF